MSHSEGKDRTVTIMKKINKSPKIEGNESSMVERIREALVGCVFGQALEMLETKASILTLYLSSADNFCKQFGPRSGPTTVGPDLDPNCLTFWWHS